MNNIQQEDHSLLEVRAWKDQCQQEDNHLTYTDYLEKIRMIAEQLKQTYHIHLQKMSLSH